MLHLITRLVDDSGRIHTSFSQFIDSKFFTFNLAEEMALKAKERDKMANGSSDRMVCLRLTATVRNKSFIFFLLFCDQLTCYTI